MDIRIYYDPRLASYGLYISDNKGDMIRIAKPLEFVKRERFENTPPCAEFREKHNFQNLIDDLWSIGMRPSARPDEYKAQLHTMNNHLNDMRTLVFKERNDLTI